MTHCDLQPGDIVKIKSGGPVMTVASLKNGNVVVCQWFVDTLMREGRFNANTLEKTKI